MKRLLSLVFIFLIWTMFLDSVLLAETREILEETDSKRDTVETSSHSVSPHFSYQYYTNDEGSNDGSGNEVLFPQFSFSYTFFFLSYTISFFPKINL